MAIPQVDLTTAGNFTFRFTFQTCGFFTASLASNGDQLTIISDNIRLQNSASSRFEVFFDKALFEFPHTELKKFKAFLEQVNAAKEAA